MRVSHGQWQLEWDMFCQWFVIMSWWRHQMETFSALLALCAGNSPVSGEFPAQRPVTRSFDVFFDLRLNKRLSKQSWGWWFETPSSSLWRHYHVVEIVTMQTSLDSHEYVITCKHFPHYWPFVRGIHWLCGAAIQCRTQTIPCAKECWFRRTRQVSNTPTNTTDDSGVSDLV